VRWLAPQRYYKPYNEREKGKEREEKKKKKNLWEKNPARTVRYLLFYRVLCSPGE